MHQRGQGERGKVGPVILILTETYINVSLDELSSLSYTLLLVEVSVRWQNRGKTHETVLQTLKPVLRPLSP